MTIPEHFRPGWTITIKTEKQAQIYNRLLLLAVIGKLLLLSLMLYFLADWTLKEFMLISLVITGVYFVRKYFKRS